MTVASASSPSLAETAALTRRVTRLSVAVAAVLTVIKAVAWLAGGSVAMLASLADSGLDVLAASLTFLAVRYAAAPPDAEHRFGHGKAEAFSALTQAGLVFASSALVAREAIGRIVRPAPLANSGWSLAVMVVSIGLTAVVVLAQSRVLRRTTSVAVTGDRAHYAADFGANLAALAGIAASTVLGSALPDALAGLAVAAWLVWGAISVFRVAATELMDVELGGEARRRIDMLMVADSRVRGVHQLRTRASGPYIHLQMHLDLDPNLSLVEAHEVMVAAEKRVLNEFPAADILIHPDPRGRAEAHGGPFPENHPLESARR
jgi:cation diffusion facilitator family transporter